LLAIQNAQVHGFFFAKEQTMDKCHWCKKEVGKDAVIRVDLTGKKCFFHEQCLEDYKEWFEYVENPIMGKVKKV